MKILAVADFHGKPNGENNLLKFLARGYDCLVLIGDITNFGPANLAESLLERVKATGVPTFAVPGNCDPKQILQVFEKHGVNLHGKRERLGDITFVGLGGSNLTPFNTPFELTEAEIQEELAALACASDANWVLVTHAPPHGTKLDQIAEGTHVGSKSIRKFIEQKQPLVALCGHVHEARNTDKLGRTLMVNPGQISKGYAAEVTINSSSEIQAKLLEI